MCYFVVMYHVQRNLTAQRYRDEILVPLAVPLLRQIGPQAVLQDDNTRPHRARLADNFLQQVRVTRMDWAACSPDLNPIENLWDLLERRVRSRKPPTATGLATTACLAADGVAGRPHPRLS